MKANKKDVIGDTQNLTVKLQINCKIHHSHDKVCAIIKCVCKKDIITSTSKLQSFDALRGFSNIEYVSPIQSESAMRCMEMRISFEYSIDIM